MSDALPAESLDRLFRSARSYNGFLDTPVTTEQLHAIWDLMKWGPTSANQMPARILWLTTAEQKAKLAALASGTNGPKIIKAPVTAIVGMDMAFYEQGAKLFPHADVRPWFAGNDAMIQSTAFRNSTLQGAYLIMAARALGLNTGPMSGFDNAAVDAAFFAGTTIKSNFLCMLGYGDPSTIFERLPRPAFEEFNTIL